MRDATAFVERIEFSLPSGDLVVVGFRSAATSEDSHAAASFFFGEEPVYQFNADFELRRGYLDGIIKAEKGGLVRLSRIRTGANVEMRRHELSPAELEDFVDAMHSRLKTLLQAIECGEARMLRSIPAGDAVAERVKTWLAKVTTAGELKIAARPNA